MEVGKKLLGCDWDTVNKKFNVIEELLEKHRDSTIIPLSHRKVMPVDSLPHTKKPAANTGTFDEHQCDKSTRCKEDWRILGLGC